MYMLVIPQKVWKAQIIDLGLCHLWCERVFICYKWVSDCDDDDFCVMDDSTIFSYTCMKYMLS